MGNKRVDTITQED